ncbi:hypothetical protein FA09DRAFT_88075 [Tilletiopsis washingtonensis]|uniref:Uncharacterized protein n=1 Tax=Tilletiopsis washingtonensis TaxID=58919 RepID=A0A316Z4B7_9BASI|nr:hypothetical protein FA09DRAFT_88075 [Tilletiopsis washingtonensis]PWN96401.1 hypothetical protein FA09DRAFT_88075 [Tilletiopsis washingtonensis]
MKSVSSQKRLAGASLTFLRSSAIPSETTTQITSHLAPPRPTRPSRLMRPAPPRPHRSTRELSIPLSVAPTLSSASEPSRLEASPLCTRPASSARSPSAT